MAGPTTNGHKYPRSSNLKALKTIEPSLSYSSLKCWLSKGVTTQTEWYVHVFKVFLAIADTVACKKAIAKWPFFVHSSLLFTNKGSKHIDLMSKKVKQGVTLRHRRRRIQATWPHYITSTAAETRIPIIPQLEMYNASRRLLKNLISQAGEYIPFERQRILTMMISWPLHYATKRICNWIKVDISTGQNDQLPKISFAKNFQDARFRNRRLYRLLNENFI